MDPVYQLLADHQRTGTQGWTLKQVISDLHEWAEVFRLRFKLEIPAMPLRLTKLRWNCLGHFNPGFNDFGLVNEIAIDVGHLVRRLSLGDWWLVLATLLHEQLHFFQQLRGKPSKPGWNNYHNVEYRDQALALGMIVSSRGVNEGYVDDGRFLTLLRERGVAVPELTQGAPVKPRGNSPLKKWVCGCKRPFNVRVARHDFRALCLYCNRPFTLEE